MKSGSKEISVLRKIDEAQLNANLLAMFTEVCDVFKLNENKTFTDAEIFEATHLLKQNYYFLKWADILLFVKNIKLGKYNDIYNRWDMPTFFAMLNKYVDERVNTATTLNRVEATQRNNEPISPETLEKIQEVKQNLRSNKVILEKTPTKDERAEFLRNEFIELLKTQGKEFPEENKRGFVVKDGNKLTCGGYISFYYNENNLAENE